MISSNRSVRAHAVLKSAARWAESIAIVRITPGRSLRFEGRYWEGNRAQLSLAEIGKFVTPRRSLPRESAAPLFLHPAAHDSLRPATRANSLVLVLRSKDAVRRRA